MTGRCSLLIYEVIVYFLECHNRIISHLTQFVKNFFLFNDLGHIPCQGTTFFERVVQPGLEPYALGGIWEGEGCAWLSCLCPVIRCLLSVD